MMMKMMIMMKMIVIWFCNVSLSHLIMKICNLHALPRDDGDVHGRKRNGKAANSIYKSGTGATTIL